MKFPLFQAKSNHFWLSQTVRAWRRWFLLILLTIILASRSPNSNTVRMLAPRNSPTWPPMSPEDTKNGKLFRLIVFEELGYFRLLRQKSVAPTMMFEGLVIIKLLSDEETFRMYVEQSRFFSERRMWSLRVWITQRITRKSSKICAYLNPHLSSFCLNEKCSCFCRHCAPREFL